MKQKQKPILDLIEEGVKEMREEKRNCPFSKFIRAPYSFPHNGCYICRLLFPKVKRCNTNCPCNYLTDQYVRNVMRHFFPVDKEVL